MEKLVTMNYVTLSKSEIDSEKKKELQVLLDKSFNIFHDFVYNLLPTVTDVVHKKYFLSKREIASSLSLFKSLKFLFL